MINTLNSEQDGGGKTPDLFPELADKSVRAPFPDVRRFKLSQIRVGDNAREEFDEVEMKKLVESMKHSREKIGSTLQPLLGVLLSDGTVELIAGERRFRAAPLAGYEELEVKVVTEVRRRDILIWNLTENTVRDNLRPTEKAKRIVQLLEEMEDSRPVWSKASLAEELGENPNVIDHCVNLMRAPDKVRAEVDGGVSLEIGGMIGALPPEQQEETANAILFSAMGPMNVMAARDYIAEHCRRDLRKAQWSREDPDLVPSAGACTKCPQWGGENAGVTGKHRVNICLNPRCFEEKTRAFQLKVEARAEDEQTKVLHEASKWFKPENNEVKPDCGYVDLADKPDAYLLEGGRAAGTPTWEKILKDSGVKHVIAFDHAGRARSLVESALAIQAAKLSPSANLFKDAAGDGIKTQSEKKLDGQIKKAQTAATNRVVRDACIELVEGLKAAWGRDMLCELYRQIVHSGGMQREDGELLLSVLDPNAKPAGDLWNQIDEQVQAKCPTAEQMGAFVVLTKNVRHIRYNGLGHIEHGMAEVCDLAEFNAKKWRKTLEAELKSAGSAVKAAAKKEATGKGKEQGAGSTGKKKKADDADSDIKDALAFADWLLTRHVPAMTPNENGVFVKPVSVVKRFAKGVGFAIELASDGEKTAVASHHEKANASGGAKPNVRDLTLDRREAIKKEITAMRKWTGSAEWNVPKSIKADHMKMFSFLCEVERHLGGSGGDKPSEPLTAGKITTANGLLYRDGEQIHLPEADDVAKAHGHTCAEQMVKALEARSKTTDKPRKSEGKSKGKPLTKPGVKVDDELKAKARKLYDQGFGKGAIAEKLGISENTVGNWQKREWPKRKPKK